MRLAQKITLFSTMFFSAFFIFLILISLDNSKKLSGFVGIFGLLGVLTFSFLLKATRPKALVNEKTADTQQFKDLADSLPILIWTANAEGVVNYISKNISTFCGLTEAEILENWLIVVHPDDHKNTLDVWQIAIQSKTLFKVEYRIRRFDGAYIWHAVQGTPVINVDGSVKHWYGSSLDIHHLKALQQESALLAAKLNSTMESITDAFITIDDKFYITFLNHYASSLLAKKPEALIGKLIWSFCDFGEESSFALQCKEAVQNQKTTRFEFFVKNSQLWLDVHLYPSIDGLTIYCTDITQQRAERQELELLRVAVSRLNDIILITEAEPIDQPGPRVVFVNEAFERRTGFSKAEILGKTPRILQGEKTQQENLAKIRKALQSWQPVRTQLINYTKSGEEFWLELDIVPLANDEGWYTHWVAVERDITTEKRTEQQLVQAQKMEALGHITGGIAHDFNNLLTVVLGNTELIKENLPSNSYLNPLTDVVLSAANRGTQLTQSLLSFSSKQSLIPAPIEVNQLLLRLKSILAPALGERHKLNFELEDGLPYIIADEAFLESSILNLVINARDAMSQPGTVTIRTQKATRADLNNEQQSQCFIVISITDTGEGIPKEFQNRIFEPFFSTKKPGYGTGLGLSMVFGFIKQTGGDIQVHSTPRQGTTFELFLPTTILALNAEAVEPRLRVETQPGYRLLLVEDDDMVRQFAVDILTHAGFMVTQASNGEAAYEYLKAGLKYDILFTDIVMPGSINGFRLAELAAELHPTLPILFTSGYSDQVDKLSELIKQDNLLLRKPYRKNELLLKLTLLISASKPKVGE